MEVPIQSFEMVEFFYFNCSTTNDSQRRTFSSKAYDIWTITHTRYSQGTDVVTTFLKYEVVKDTRLKYLKWDLGWSLRERMQEDRARTGNKVMVRQATYWCTASRVLFPSWLVSLLSQIWTWSLKKNRKNLDQDWPRGNHATNGISKESSIALVLSRIGNCEQYS